MKNAQKWLIAACFLLVGQAWAAGQSQDDANRARSEAEKKAEEQAGKVGVTNLAIRPEVGAVIFNGNQRFVGGAMIDFNLISVPWMKIGPSIGALYSSVGAGDFFSGVSMANNEYIFQLPGNLKATFSPDPTDRLQLGVHGGANIIRSSSGVINTGGVAGGPGVFGGSGANLGSNPGSSWDVHPNVGGDIDFALGTNADLTLRPDVTFMPNFNMLTATVGLGLKL